MKRYLMVTMAVVAAAGIGCRFYFKTTTERFSIQPTSSSVSNGKNLVFNICAGCHYNEGVKKMTGFPLNDLPKIAGHLVSANLTHSKTYGKPDKYSDAELFYLLKTGISRSGKFMPYMMRPTMADEDINDIIAFLRSDDPSLDPAETSMGKTKINLIGRMGIRMASKPQPYTKGVKRPDMKNDVEYGRYMVGIVGCYHCHSKKVFGLNYSEPEKSKGYLQGGMKLKDPEGKKIFSPNLTPDKETGIGGMSLHEFTKAVTSGVAPSGRKLSPPMPVFSDMTDTQVKAIYAYLHSLPPVHHAVKRRT